MRFEYINKIKKHITPKGLGIAGIVLAVAAGFALFSVKTADDAKNMRKDISSVIVTRFPMVGTFFLGKTPPSAILLSWYDNTLRLDEEGLAQDKLGAVLYPVTVTDRMLIYATSDESIVEVDGEGNITAKAPGSVEITVKNEYTKRQSKAFLEVIQPVTGFYLQKSTVNLFTTDMSMRLNAVIMPENASNTIVKWYSKDTGIVEVDSTGHLKPVSTGMTEIVATTADGGLTAKCFVNVINEVIKAESVTILNKEGVELNIGEQWSGIASVLPANAKNATVEWESSDPAVASVTKTGIVKALAPGNVIVTARNNDGPSDTVEIKVNGITDSTDIDMNPTYTVAGGINYTVYNMTLDDMARTQMKTVPTYNDGSGLKAADFDRVRMYVDPNEFCSESYKYQFMDLSRYNGISREALSAFLAGKGILSGKADVFIEAARQYNVSELYLVAHACVETGYGGSTLANGVTVEGVTVYNMYGIGAFDTDAVGTGSKKAYNEGWTTPEAAIKGGARWISENYINAYPNRQNTLYKMRWNPDKPGEHLYAGDVAWAVTQSTIMERLFAQIPDAVISYEIPVYSGSNAAKID